VFDDSDVEDAQSKSPILLTEVFGDEDEEAVEAEAVEPGVELVLAELDSVLDLFLRRARSAFLS